MLNLKLLQDLWVLYTIPAGTIKTESEWMQIIGRKGGITWEGKITGSDTKWFEIVEN